MSLRHLLKKKKLYWKRYFSNL